MRSTRLVILVCITLSSSILSAQKVTYIGNEGVLIEYQGTKILIDGLFKSENPKFLAPDDATMQSMLAGTAPYDNIRYVLATHIDPDHFDEKLTFNFLTGNPSAILITTPEAIKSITSAHSDVSKFKDRIKDVPYVKTWFQYADDKVDIKAAYTHHAGEKNYDIQHLTFLIKIGDKKILHLGDSEQDLSRFEYLKYLNENVDIAFVPFFYLTNLFGTEAIAKYIAPKKVVGIHYPLAAGETSAPKIAQYAPKAVLFQTQGQTITF